MNNDNKWPFPGRKGDLHKTIFKAEETVIIPGYIDEFGNRISADPYGMIITNTSASNCNVTIRDAISGNIRDVFAIPPNDVRGFMIHPDGARKQTLGNNAWTATLSAGVSNIEITSLFIRNS